MPPEKEYKCEFCNKYFVRESWYKKHMCEKKQRFESRNELSTIKAHKLFCQWQRMNRYTKRGKRDKNMKEFTQSPYFNAFVKVQKFIQNNYVVSGDRYISWIVWNKIPEPTWCSKNTLTSYLEYIQENEKPENQAKQTFRAMVEWADDTGNDITDFFTVLTPGQALNMIRENKLTPWVMFGYKDCVDDLTGRFEGDPLYALDDHINIQYWFDRVKDNPRQQSVLNTTLDDLLSDYLRDS